MSFLTTANRTIPASNAIDALAVPASSAVSGLARKIALWLKVSAERRALRDLGYSRLADLGIDPQVADREASRPFWSITTRH